MIEYSCLSCGTQISKTCGRQSKYCKKCYPEYRRSYNLLHSIENRCKKKKIEFDLDFEWIYSRLKKGCEITGLKFVLEIKKNNHFGVRHTLAPSVDRIDPSKGYTKDNCRMIAWWINCAKQQYSDLELWHLCSLVVKSLNVNHALNAGNVGKTPVEII